VLKKKSKLRSRDQITKSVDLTAESATTVTTNKQSKDLSGEFSV
jgi:hypothetical protein